MKSVLRFFSVSSLFFSCKRLIFLLLLLSGFASAAWGYNISANTVIYFDASSFESIGTNKVVLMVGHNTWSQGYEMTKVEGSIYMVTMPKWDGCTQLAFFLDDTVLSGTGKKIDDRKSNAIKTTTTFTIDKNLATRASFYVDNGLHRENGAMAYVYFNNTNLKWDDANIYLFLGHDSYSRSDYKVTRVPGTKDLYVSTVAYWDNAKYIAFAKDQWSKSGESNSIKNRLPWQGNYNYTQHYSITNTSTTSYIYTPSATAARWGGLVNNESQSRYSYPLTRTAYSTPKVTVTTPTNGTISLKDYDDRAVTASASGTEVPYLTVLKITATPNANYELVSVTVGDKTYTAAEFTQDMEYTVTAATTISATFKATSCTEAPTVTNGTTSPTSTETTITAYGKVTALGTNCTLSETGVKLYSDANCTTEVATIHSSPTSNLNTEYSVEFTNLLPSTTYYAKAYAATAGGTAYASNAVEIRTADPCLAAGKTIYLKPNDNWKVDNAYFAAYFFIGEANTWVKLTPVDTDPTVYQCTIPEGGYNGLIFTRMNPASEDPNWDTAWNQTADLSGNCEANLFTVPNDAWNGSADEGNWTQYTPPACVTFTPVLNQPTKISVGKPTTFTLTNLPSGYVAADWEWSNTADDLDEGTLTPIADSPSATFTALNEGTYTIRVRAKKDDCYTEFITHTFTAVYGDACTESEKIIILCRENSGNTNLKLYAWDMFSSTIDIQWPGQDPQTTITYNGKTYAYWEFSNHEKINIVFNKNSGECKTNDITELTIGHRYIYELNDWCGKNAPTPTIEPLYTASSVSALSAEQIPGTLQVNFIGRIDDSGCAAIITHGFQYRKKGDANWSQHVYHTAKMSSGETFQLQTPDLEAGSTYEFRARAVSNYNDNSKVYSLEPYLTVTIQANFDQATIGAVRGKTTVCPNNYADFASLFVVSTGKSLYDGYKASAYQWMYSTDNTNWNPYTPDKVKEGGYGVTGANNNIRSNQAGYYRCDITLTKKGSADIVLPSNVIQLTENTICQTLQATGWDFPVMYIQTSQDFPTCDKQFNSQCGEDMKAKRTVDVKMYNKGDLCYDRKARMNIRGSSSLNFPKKSYAFVGGKADAKDGGDVKTDKLGFFGLPEHKDWVLYAAYADASMIRNMLAMQAYGTMTGMWSCHTQYVQVYMDGKFEGIYIFMEKPTYGKGRVMVDENNGYLFGFDKTSVNDRFESTDNSIDAKKCTFKSMYSGRDGITSYNTQFDQRFEIEYPEREKIAFDDDENLVNEQAWTDKVNKLKARINEFEEALSTRNYDKVRSVIDYQTWADWFIINEFCKNLDGFRASNWFIIENEGAPIKASPIWDFELSFGNKAPNSNIAESTEGWLHEQDGMHTDGFPIPFWINGIGATNNNTGDKGGTGWTINADVNFGALLKDPCFKQMVKERWAIHTSVGGGIQQLISWAEDPNNYIYLQNILEKEEARWPAAQRGVMGYDAQDTWNTQYIAVRNWVTPRKEAMDALIASWNLGYMHAMIKDAEPQDWTTLRPAKEEGVDVYTLNEGREKLVLVGYTKATDDPEGAGLENDMQAATIWKFYPSTENLRAADLDNLEADKWQFLHNSGNYHLPALSQNECGYYKVEGPICSSNLQSTYMRIKVTPTCEQDDCNSYWYRLKLTDKQSGTVFYSSIIKGIEGTAEGTVAIPCYGEFDYVAQCKHDDTYWSDIEIENTNRTLVAASFRGVTTLKVLLDNCKANAEATNLVVKFVEQTEGVTPYYQVGFYYGGELITGTTSLNGETGITLKESASFENLHLPTGATYAIYKRDNVKSYDALYSCIVEQGYIPNEFTNLPVNQSVTATLTVDADGKTTVTFSTEEKEPKYWVSTVFAGQKGFDRGKKDEQVESDDTDNNTMLVVDCTGQQAGATGNFYLYKYMVCNDAWGAENDANATQDFANSGVKDGYNNNAEVATHADGYKFHKGQNSVWVRWLYNQNQGQLHVHYVRDMHLEVKDAAGNTERIAPTTSSETAGTMTFQVDDLTNVASYRIVAKPPHTTDSYDQFPYGAEYQTIATNLGSATFTYNYAQNCMTVDYTDITTLEIPCDNNGISINKDGRVEVIVNNTGTKGVLEGAYTVVVKDHTAKLTMRGSVEKTFVGKALAVGESETFTSTEIINGNYYLQASLYLGTKLLATCSLRDLNCDYAVIDTVRYTVDANLGIEYEDPCQLTFGSLENAIKHLKSTPKFVKGGSLVYPVVMEVAYSKTTYKGTRAAGVSGGGEQSQNSMAIIIDNINQMDASRPLIIRSNNKDTQPWVQHVIIRNSRNVTLDGLFLVSDVTGTLKDNALEFDINVADWDIIPTGDVKDANIVVKNSTIGSSGFTGLHASGYDGITFINNNFEAVFDGSDANSVTWGASAKFIRCKNIQFLRNNFRGDHATLVWLQECTDALFMNNVFWNTNKYQGRCAAIRLISQFGFPVNNMAFYYNTLYLADSEINSYKYDFLHFGQQHESVGSYPDSYTNIEFMYNNAYSYDTDIPGRNTDAEAFYGIDVRTKYPNFCNNNFWSEYDQILWETKYSNSSNWHSKFSFGCNQDMINVKDQLCGTTATGPASLIVRGEDLNIGVRPSSDIANALGASKGHDHDRYNTERPSTGTKWTLGAYQQGTKKVTNTIIWQGVASSDWDDRNNWIDKETGMRLNCLNLLSTNLVAIIPAEFSKQYPTPAEGIRNWPKIPENFTEGRTNMAYDEHVSAGLGTAKTPGEITQYVSSIIMEFGSGIEGVENLVENAGEKEEIRRYNQVTYNFDVERSKWYLVGTVVKKEDAQAEGGYRNVISGDYYIANHEPHVYMHQALIDPDTRKADWAASFPNLDVEVPADKVFAIQIPDQYGPNKLTAKRYYRKDPDQSKLLWGSKPWQYTFTGRFVNESALPVYSGLTAGTPVLLNNTYPMNIDARVIEEKGLGSVLLYDYEMGSFENIAGDGLIKPQHGFVIEPTGSSLAFTPDMLVGGDTKSRSVGQEKSLYILKLNKANATSGAASTIHLVYDEAADGLKPVGLDTRKVYSYNASTPDLYMLMYDNAYQRLHVGNSTKTIALGISLQESMPVSFEKVSNSGFNVMTLVDTHTGKEYNLLGNDKIVTETLPAGVTEGRFYLNIEVNNDFVADDDVTTPVESITDQQGIQLYVQDGSTISITTTKGELKTVYVSDITGRTQTYNVHGTHVKIRPPVANGVYTVRVVGNETSRIEKVILNK